MCATRTRHGLTFNAGVFLASNRRLVGSGPQDCDRSRVNWDDFARCQVRAYDLLGGKESV